jgi:molecular chaperone Hsp33
MSSSKSEAWSQLATGALLRASLLEGEERVVAQLQGEGATHGMYAEANALGEVRGFCLDNESALEESDYIEATGSLVLQTVKYRMQKPYTSSTPYDGDIAKAWQDSFDLSDGIPTFVYLETKYDSNGEPHFIGGLLAQALPPPSPLRKIIEKETGDKGGAGEKGKEKEKLGDTGRVAVQTLSDMFFSGEVPSLEEVSTSAGLVEYVRLALKAPQVEESSCEIHPVDFHCRCTKAGYLSHLYTLPVTDIDDLIMDNGIDLNCHFCNKVHAITQEELVSIRDNKVPVD